VDLGSDTIPEGSFASYHETLAPILIADAVQTGRRRSRQQYRWARRWYIHSENRTLQALSRSTLSEVHVTTWTALAKLQDLRYVGAAAS
jgi:hypothetical protein